MSNSNQIQSPDLTNRIGELTQEHLLIDGKHSAFELKNTIATISFYLVEKIPEGDPIDKADIVGYDLSRLYNFFNALEKLSKKF